MAKLPQVSARETIKALEKIGFAVIHQRGSHIKLIRKFENSTQTVIVPEKKVIKKGTLRNEILKSINLSVEEFVKLLKD